MEVEPPNRRLPCPKMIINNPDVWYPFQNFQPFVPDFMKVFTIIPLPKGEHSPFCRWVLWIEDKKSLHTINDEFCGNLKKFLVEHKPENAAPKIDMTYSGGTSWNLRYYITDCSCDHPDTENKMCEMFKDKLQVTPE